MSDRRSIRRTTGNDSVKKVNGRISVHSQYGANDWRNFLTKKNIVCIGNEKLIGLIKLTMNVEEKLQIYLCAKEKS